MKSGWFIIRSLGAGLEGHLIFGSSLVLCFLVDSIEKLAQISLHYGLTNESHHAVPPQWTRL